MRYRYVFTVWLLLAITAARAGESAPAPVAMTLDQVLNQALQKNQALKAAEFQVQAAQKKVWVAKSSFLPTIQYVGSYNWYEKPMIIIPIHEPRRLPPLDDRVFNSQLQLRLPIFAGGQRFAAHKLAQAGFQESGAQKKVVENKVIQSVANLFLQARELQGKRELVTRRLEALRERQRELLLLKREGRVSEADAALLQASLQSTIADSVQLASAWEQLTYRLGQVVGVKYPIAPAVEASGAPTAIPADLFPDTTAADMRLNNPELKKAHTQLVKAHAMKNLAIHSFLPSVSGYYTHLLNSSGNDWDPSDEYAFGITFQIPLFEGGRRIANLSAASAAEKAAQANLEHTRLEQRTALEIAYFQWKAARQRRQLIGLSVQSKQKYVEASRKLYQEGRLPLSDLLMQETELLALQLQEQELQYAEQKAILDYQILIGHLNEQTVKEIIH
jgi:outer membrane protein TolC